MIFRSKNVSKGISHPVFYVHLVYKLKRVKDTPNFISSSSKIVKRLRRRQYDPLIIERIIGLVIGPSTALFIPFLKHCTLTNKAVGTIWRALSKPSWRRQVSWSSSPLIVSRDSFSHQTLNSLPDGRSIACPIRMSLYIFLQYNIYHLCFTCIYFWWRLRLGWLFVSCLFMEVNLQIFKRVSFWLHGCCGKWEGLTRKPG